MMGISVYLENQVHKRQYAGGEVSRQLERILAVGAKGILSRGIYAHGDTMFNMIQLGHLNAEFDNAAKAHPEIASDVDSFKMVTQKAIEER